MAESELTVVGISGESCFSRIERHVEDSGSILFSSETVLEMIQHGLGKRLRAKWRPITPLDDALEAIGLALERERRVIVAVGGDPLFFGIGKILTQHFPDRRLSFEPAVSSMQLCFARYRLPWDRAEMVSLHGRPLATLIGKLAKPFLFVFTDPRNSPERIAEFVIEQAGPVLKDDFRFYVGERLGRSGERLIDGTAEEIAKQRFEQPNCLIIRNLAEPTSDSHCRFGLDELDISHSRGLITKNEIRATVLHGLCLPKQGILWDIGAGSGSVSIEASRLNPELVIYAVEKKAEQLEHIHRNRERYRGYNIAVKAGEAPEALASLPRPDRIFIGGSGGRLEQIVGEAATALVPGGVLVLTAVTEATIEKAPRLLDEYGLACRISVISVKRVSNLKKGPVTRELNPIQIITARKGYGH